MDNVTDASISAYYETHRKPYLIDARKFGKIDAYAFRQPAGSYPDPASNYITLSVPLWGCGVARCDFGAGRFEGDGTGKLSLSSPNTNADYEIDHDHEVLALGLPTDLLSDLVRQTGGAFTGDFGILHTGFWRDKELRDLCLKVWKATASDDGASDLDPDDTLLKMAILLARRAQTGFTLKDRIYKLAPHTKARVLEYINEHLEEELTLFQLAAVAGLSPFHFARSFRHDMGDTPRQLVMRQRISKARNLIQTTDLSFTEIAQAAGFSSQSRMNDCFSREDGRTPGQVRRAATGH